LTASACQAPTEQEWLLAAVRVGGM